MRSLSGPTTSWPSARPATHAVSVSWTCDALEPSVREISGKAGRYMSIESGPIAFTAPSTTTSCSAAARPLARALSSWTAEVTLCPVAPARASRASVPPVHAPDSRFPARVPPLTTPPDGADRPEPTQRQASTLVQAGMTPARPASTVSRVRTLVTGGAGFIGSNLVDALVARGDEVAILDDLSTGRRANLDDALAAGAVLVEGARRDGGRVPAVAAAPAPDIVFHLGAQIDVRR